MTVIDHIYSDKYLPKNRTATGLGTIETEVRGPEYRRVLEPNDTCILALKERLPVGMPSPSTPSTISGEPGFLVRLDVLEMQLSHDELLRFWRRNLRPEEFFALAERFGIFYEISDKYYDENTGAARSPLLSYKEQDNLAKLAEVPHLLVVKDAEGNLMAHSVMHYPAAVETAKEFAQKGINAVAARLTMPEGIKLHPLLNRVALWVDGEGVVRAAGPFEPEALIDEAQFTCVAGEKASFSYAVVNATCL